MNTGMSSPWVLFVAKLKKFFEEDNDIHIDYNPNSNPNLVNIRVDDETKHYALSNLLESKIYFGNFELEIRVIPANFASVDKVALFKSLFKDMSIVDEIDEITPEGTSNTFTYILFKNQVVKYWSDNLGNPHGNNFTLYEDLANDIFSDHAGVLFTTAEE